MELGSRWSGTVVMLSDPQLPFVDHQASACAKKLVAEIRPDLLCFGGDIVDLDACGPENFRSTLPGHRRSGERLRVECLEAGEWMADMRRASRCKKAVLLFGNHEDRPPRRIREKMPELDGAVSVAEWLDLEKLGIPHVEYQNGNGHVWVGDRYKGIVLMHGYLFRSKKRGMSALAHIAKLDCSVMHGHTNACVVVKERRPSRTLYGVEAGCLCSLDDMAAQYAPWPDAQHGIGYAVLKNGVLQYATAVPIEDGVAYAPGRRIE